MKKYKYTLKSQWYYLVLVLVCLLIIPFIIRLFHKNHLVEYSLSKYKVEEEFFIEDGKHNYNFTLSKDDRTYIFSIDQNFSKKKKVLANILEYEEGNISCILPITKKKSLSNLVCLKDSKQVSNYLLKDDSNYLKIVEEATNYKGFQEDNEPKEYQKLLVYSNNILDDQVFYIWNYKGIYVLEKENISYQKILDFDLYENIMATTVGKTYVLFDNSSAGGIDKVYCYNPNSKKLYNFKLNIKLEKDSYINGVRGNLIYVTDKKKKIQYKIDIVKGEIEVVGNEEILYITYINGEKTLLNKSDFFMKKQLFDSNHIMVNEKSDCIYDSRYNYCIDESNFIKMNSKKNEVALFNIDDVTEWGMQNHELLILKEDTLYSYDDYYGLRKIVEYRELHYNYSNIYKLGS